MKEEIKSVYQTRLENFNLVAKTTGKKNDQITLARIIFFIISLVGIVYFANARNTIGVMVVLLIFLVVFSLIVKFHNKIKEKFIHLDNLAEINREEIQKLSGNLRDFETGEKYQEPGHPYTADLDVFGNHSLFQLINRSNTEKGKEKLADWLKTAADKPIVLERQEAIKELVNHLDWRQDFQAYGKDKPKSKKTKEEETDAIKVLLDWVQEEDSVKNWSLYKTALFILPVITLAAIVAYFAFNISGYFTLMPIIINILILWTTKDAATVTHAKTSKSITVLRAYRYMIRQIENSTFKSELLRNLQKNFRHQSYVASEEIKKLQNILDNLDNRANVFYLILNFLFLLDVYWLLKADTWKSKNRKDIKTWFSDISEFEALNGLAGFSYSNPDYVFPEIADEPYTYSAKTLGHCLIKDKNRISNNYQLAGKGAIAVITGSNMSGKSTFLRTVGINAVLALSGAPVCAEEMTISKMQVFTSMRTQDSLEESVSSFYAELRRLKQLLETVAKGEPVLFMLDEILKGTNSHDRHNGAASLIRQLSKLNATGLISTHDLELGDLEAELPNVKNYSFNSSIENDEIFFDYKLHEGVCKSFNASKLMEKMGIAIQETNPR